MGKDAGVSSHGHGHSHEHGNAHEHGYRQSGDAGRAAKERWLAALWPFVLAQLPAPRARVVEIGCGSLGGFVPRLDGAGYQATGVDPEAPDEPGYCRTEFERYEPPEPADAIIACVSLHHVADLDEVLSMVEYALAPGGRVVIVEWARERFDEATARWAFDRLPPPGDEPSWLHEQHSQWRASGRPWEPWCRSWAESENMYDGHEVLRGLTARFGPGDVSYGPFFFSELAGTSEADEQAAIDSGQIQANRIDYVGRRPS
jgi:SAM-dependent methyltransferase